MVLWLTGPLGQSAAVGALVLAAGTVVGMVGSLHGRRCPHRIGRCAALIGALGVGAVRTFALTQAGHHLAIAVPLLLAGDLVVSSTMPVLSATIADVVPHALLGEAYVCSASPATPSLLGPGARRSRRHRDPPTPVWCLPLVRDGAHDRPRAGPDAPARAAEARPRRGRARPRYSSPRCATRLLFPGVPAGRFSVLLLFGWFERGRPTDENGLSLALVAGLRRRARRGPAAPRLAHRGALSATGSLAVGGFSCSARGWRRS